MSHVARVSNPCLSQVYSTYRFLWCYDIDFEKAFTIDFQKDDFTCIVIVIEKDDLWKEIRERT